MYIYHRLNARTMKVEEVQITWTDGVTSQIDQRVTTCRYISTAHEFDDVNFILALGTVADVHLLSMWHVYRKLNENIQSLTCAVEFVKMINRHVIQ